MGKWLWLLLVIIVGAGAAGGTYYYMHQQENKKTAQVTAQITGLETQLAKLQAELKGSSSGSSSTTFKVPELGLQFTTSSDISDLSYYYDSSLGYARFSTKSLASAGGATCVASATNGGPIGSITLSTTAPSSTSGSDSSLGTYVKQVGSKYLYDQAPQAVCSTSSSNQTLETNQESSLKQALLSATATQ
jgi:hypothetical protein